MKTKALLLAAAFVLAAAGLQSPLKALAVGTGTHSIPAQNPAKPLTLAEIRKIEVYMQQVFGNEGIRLVHTAPEAEVYFGEHFLGVIYPDDQPEGRTFYFEMAIFEEELGISPLPLRRR